MLPIPGQIRQPAPEYTAEERAVYDAALVEMAEVLPDEELVRFVASYGATLQLDARGLLKAKNPENRPAAGSRGRDGPAGGTG